MKAARKTPSVASQHEAPLFKPTKRKKPSILTKSEMDELVAKYPEPRFLAMYRPVWEGDDMRFEEIDPDDYLGY